MHVIKNPAVAVLALSTLCLPPAPAVQKQHWALDENTPAAVLWRNPADLASRNLFYGPGGERDRPRGPYTYVKEDLKGSSPKFVVRDGQGVLWKVKLGIEARPETAATRIVWAAGYFTNEDYFLPALRVLNMPAHLHRGWKYVGPDGSVHNARLKRMDTGEKKVGDWRWRRNPFTNTRELNGLRVLMAVINNWDLKDVNNHIYQEGPEQVYMVSDLGASFGWVGRRWPASKAKGNLDSYSHSRFIRHVTPATVDFAVPARESLIYAVDLKEYIKRIHLEWIGKGIPLDDARWMGGLLARLSPRQLRDAFRAAGYTPQEADGFTAVVERRIAMLTDL